MSINLLLLARSNKKFWEINREEVGSRKLEASFSIQNRADISLERHSELVSESMIIEEN